MKKTLLLISALIIGGNSFLNAQQNRFDAGAPVIATSGAAGGALNFTASNDYVNLGNTSTLNLKNTFTIETWIKPSVNLSAYSRIIENNYQTGFFFGTGAGGMNLSCILNNTFMESSGNNLTAGVWQHVAVTFNNTTDVVKMYVNEVEVYSGTYSGTIPGNSENVKLGVDWSLVTNWEFKGEMDEMRIWTSARSATQLADNNNCELLGTETGLIAYYKFNHGTAFGSNAGVTTLTDYAGTPQNGTLMNFALTGATSNWVSQSTSVNAIPTVVVTSDVATVCDGSNAVLTVSGADTYVWDLDGSTLTTLVVTPNAGPTTYSVTGTTLLGCTKTTSTTIGWNPLPTVSVVASPTVVCTGDPSTMTASGALTYSWSHGEIGSTTSVAPPVPTSYTVTGTDENGCSDNAVITINAITCSGIAAEALIFDGTNDKVIGNNSLLPQGSTPRTFTAWINPSRVTGASQTIFSYGGQATGTTAGMLIDGNSGNLYFVGQNNDVNGTSACAITPNVWTHVAISLSGSTVRFYINGALKYTGTTPTTPTTTGTSWAISNAGWSSPTFEPFSGRIDEVTVWNRALTVAEIGNTLGKEISASGQTGLIGLYHFNQGFAGGSNGTTTTLVDASTSASTGTLANIALIGSASNWIAPGRGGKTKLKDIYCGTTLANLSATLTCEIIGNATNYQWEFTDISNNAVFTYLRGSNINNFYFSSAPQLTYGKTYSVQVKAYVNGIWGAYGESCQISTPSFPTTNVSSPSCGSTLAAGNSPINCVPVATATDYEWEITDQVTFATVTKLRGTSLTNFYLYTIPGGAVYGRDYSIRVRAISGGVAGAYGSACIIKMAVPGTRLLNTESEQNTIENGEIKLNLFPNPSNGIFNIESSSVENVEVVVYDALGKVVLQEKMKSNTQSFNIENKENGIYLVRVLAQNKTIYTGRIIKQ